VQKKIFFFFLPHVPLPLCSLPGILVITWGRDDLRCQCLQFQSYLLGCSEFLFVFETESHYVAQAGLELGILSSQPSQC
jgi:hypothetical protein